MRVYRVDKPFGDRTRGPYQWHDAMDPALRNLTRDIDDAHDDGDHPTPGEDGIKELIPSNFVFGFENSEQLSTWFAGFGTRLDQTGFRVSVYEVPTESVKVGRSQVAFPRDTAIMVETYQPSAFIS